MSAGAAIPRANKCMYAGPRTLQHTLKPWWVIFLSLDVTAVGLRNDLSFVATFTRITNPTGFQAIACAWGDDFLVALRGDLNVWAAGDNRYGRRCVRASCLGFLPNDVPATS